MTLTMITQTNRNRQPITSATVATEATTETATVAKATVPGGTMATMAMVPGDTITTVAMVPGDTTATVASQDPPKTTISVLEAISKGITNTEVPTVQETLAMVAHTVTIVTEVATLTATTVIHTVKTTMAAMAVSTEAVPTARVMARTVVATTATMAATVPSTAALLRTMEASTGTEDSLASMAALPQTTTVRALMETPTLSITGLAFSSWLKRPAPTLCSVRASFWVSISVL